MVKIIAIIGILPFITNISFADDQKLDSKEIVSFEEILTSNVYTQEDLINLLEKKGIISKDELLEEIIKLRGRKKT